MCVQSKKKQAKYKLGRNRNLKKKNSTQLDIQTDQ